ncbi:phage baseplate assembly protein V [Halomonas sp. PBN3]|uniref:phage baseplate assembly protein V n=1 Tax=Halomonas sp. PBN3 TaxID=1397528 RepID=UPI0003B9260A|nr:phage baseplate assembly protein V [Halomonas sp. PBN3]ERS88738.1 baseplate assembly protein [Halomonas sp. PBN3]
MSQRPLHSAAELLRLIHNLIRLGTVAEVDHASARCRVQIGELTTAWLPWLEERAGTTRTWNPPTVGEQVVVFAPGGDMASAVVLAGLYRATHPAPSDSPDVWREVMPDGAVIEYDHAAHRLLAETGPSKIVMDRDRILLESNGSTIELDASGIRLNGARIDLN